MIDPAPSSSSPKKSGGLEQAANTNQVKVNEFPPRVNKAIPVHTFTANIPPAQLMAISSSLL
jgi:hypothetical protein